MSVGNFWEIKTSLTYKTESLIADLTYYHYEAGEEWLGKQGERCGFLVKNLIVENHQFHKVRKPKDPNLRQFTSIDFHGQIQVTEPQKFIDIALFNGLGRSKSFGCGLLLIRRT